MVFSVVWVPAPVRALSERRTARLSPTKNAAARLCRQMCRKVIEVNILKHLNAAQIFIHLNYHQISMFSIRNVRHPEPGENVLRSESESRAEIVIDSRSA